MGFKPYCFMHGFTRLTRSHQTYSGNTEAETKTLCSERGCYRIRVFLAINRVLEEKVKPLSPHVATVNRTYDNTAPFYEALQQVDCFGGDIADASEDLGIFQKFWTDMKQIRSF